jgi:hypothetical protein
MESGEIRRQPQGGVHAQWIGHGRVWVESLNSIKKTALVRFDPGEGMRSRAKSVPLSEIDFGFVGWNGWRTLKS